GGDVQRGRRAGATAQSVTGADQRFVPASDGAGDCGRTAVPGRVGGSGVGARGGANPAGRAGLEFRSDVYRDAPADVRLARTGALGDQRKPTAAGECRDVPPAHRVGTVSVANGRDGCADRHASRVDLRAADSAPTEKPRPEGTKEGASRS